MVRHVPCHAVHFDVPAGAGRADQGEGSDISTTATTEAGRRPRGGPALPPVRVALVKVPEATAAFWITKVLTTGMGETTSDFLGAHRPEIGGPLAALALVGSLWRQLRARRYSAGVYWSAVVMVSVVGTMAADGLHAALGTGYEVTVPVFAAILAAVLLGWYRSQGTLSIHSIGPGRAERYYWGTVMATFALGTAVGDLCASTLHLGYFSSGVMFAVLFALPGLAYRWLRLGGVAAFWTAYILTRPLGASFADWTADKRSSGGLGWGTGPVSLACLVVIAVFVGYLALARRGRTADAQPVPAEPDATARHRRS